MRVWACSGQDGVILGNLQYPYMCTVDNMYAPYGGPTKVRFASSPPPLLPFAPATVHPESQPCLHSSMAMLS